MSEMFKLSNENFFSEYIDNFSYFSRKCVQLFKHWYACQHSGIYLISSFTSSIYRKSRYVSCYYKQVCSENNGNFFVSRVWIVLLSNFSLLCWYTLPCKSLDSLRKIVFFVFIALIIVPRQFHTTYLFRITFY